MTRISNADVIEVVRCKDCIHGIREDDPNGYVYCDIFGYGGYLPENWYCADGERWVKDDNANSDNAAHD